MIITLKTFFSFSFMRILLLALLTPTLFVGMRTYHLYNKIQEFQTCREAVDFMIQHKTTFLVIYKVRVLQDNLMAHFYEPEKKSYYDALSDWVEARIMAHIENHDEVNSTTDLPWLERSAIRALDASSYVGDLYQRMMYYITGSKR